MEGVCPRTPSPNREIGDRPPTQVFRLNISKRNLDANTAAENQPITPAIAQL